MDVKVGEVYLSGAGCPVRVLELVEDCHRLEWGGDRRLLARVEYVDETNNYGYGMGAIGLLPADYLTPKATE